MPRTGRADVFIRSQTADARAGSRFMSSTPGATFVEPANMVKTAVHELSKGNFSILITLLLAKYSSAWEAAKQTSKRSQAPDSGRASNCGMPLTNSSRAARFDYACPNTCHPFQLGNKAGHPHLTTIQTRWSMPPPRPALYCLPLPHLEALCPFLSPAH